MEESHNVCPKCSERKDEIGPETLMLELGGKFFEKSSAPDWFVRKEALEKLHKVLQNHQILKDGNYQPLLTLLRKIILTDLCVVVVVLAVQCVTIIAKGLGKHFSKYADGMSQILFEKFVEKRQKMTELLREAVDTIAETTRFESLLNILTRLLKHHNPSIRYEIILFLTRSFPKCNKRLLSKPQIQPLFQSLKALLGDGDIVIREKTLAALGAAAQVAGEKAILPYIRDLDLASKAKIEVYQMRAWEIAKTYNEMKFPNFRERIQKGNVTECLFNEEGSEVSIPLKEESGKLDVTDLVSNMSDYTGSSNDWRMESEKKLLEAANSYAQHCISILSTKNVSTDSNMEFVSSEPIKKDLSLPTGSQLNASGYTPPVPVPIAKLFHVSSHSNIDVAAEQSSAVSEKHKSDPDTLGDLKKEIVIHRFTNLTDIAHQIKEMTKERRLITYRHQKTDEVNQIHDNKTGNIKKVVEPEHVVEESQIGFTKKELDDLLHILNAARFRARAKETVRFKRKSHSKKHHRFTTMSKGFLTKADHKEIQCTSAVSLKDKPTQTLHSKEEKPNSISCIVNCCDKCTRLLLATSPPDSKYFVPLKTTQKNQRQPAEESSDNTVYRELISSDQMKSRSDLIKDSLENQLYSKGSGRNHSSKITPYEMKNCITLHNMSMHDKAHKYQYICPEKEVIKEKDFSIEAQLPPIPERKICSRYKRIFSRNAKASTCNKTTYVTTTSQRKKRKRRKNRSSYASLNNLSKENKPEWNQKQYFNAESKRAMKVRVIRIE